MGSCPSGTINYWGDDKYTRKSSDWIKEIWPSWVKSAVLLNVGVKKKPHESCNSLERGDIAFIKI